jgi:S1-C subfamily serine protease
MRGFSFWSVLVSLFSIGGLSDAMDGAEPKLEARWKAAVSLRTHKTDPNGNSTWTLGSGFLLKNEQDVYLVTAAHVAVETNAKSTIKMRAADKIVEVSLEEVGYSQNNTWRSLPQYDIAVLQFTDSKTADSQCVSFSSVTIDEVPIKTDIEIVGFPFGIGTSDFADVFVPVVVEGDICSCEFLSRIGLRSGEGERIILATPPVASGTSGGPVFAQLSANEWSLIGIYSGYLTDAQSPKVSKIVSIHSVERIIRHKK